MPAMSCPKCKATMSYVPELAGKPVSCPSCGQRFRSPVIESQPKAAAPVVTVAIPQSPPSPPSSPPAVAPKPDALPSFAAIDVGRPTFRPREYPAMKFIIIVLYVLAGLVAMQFVFSMFLMFFSTGVGVLASSGQSPGAGGMLAGLIGMVILFVISLVFHGTFVILFLGSAESIKIWIDIQRNTQESAHFAKLAAT